MPVTKRAHLDRSTLCAKSMTWASSPALRLPIGVSCPRRGRGPRSRTNQHGAATSYTRGVSEVKGARRRGVAWVVAWAIPLPAKSNVYGNQGAATAENHAGQM